MRKLFFAAAEPEAMLLLAKKYIQHECLTTLF